MPDSEPGMAPSDPLAQVGAGAHASTAEEATMSNAEMTDRQVVRVARDEFGKVKFDVCLTHGDVEIRHTVGIIDATTGFVDVLHSALAQVREWAWGMPTEYDRSLFVEVEGGAKRVIAEIRHSHSDMAVSAAWEALFIVPTVPGGVNDFTEVSADDLDAFTFVVETELEWRRRGY